MSKPFPKVGAVRLSSAKLLSIIPFVHSTQLDWPRLKGYTKHSQVSITATENVLSLSLCQPQQSNVGNLLVLLLEDHFWRRAELVLQRTTECRGLIQSQVSSHRGESFPISQNMKYIHLLRIKISYPNQQIQSSSLHSRGCASCTVQLFFQPRTSWAQSC